MSDEKHEEIRRLGSALIEKNSKVFHPLLFSSNSVKEHVTKKSMVTGTWAETVDIFGSFLDLPLILGCGDQLCQILAASTRQLPPQKFDLTQRICHHLLYQILFSGENVFEDQIIFPSKQTFCSCLHSVSSHSARNSLEVHSVPSSELFLAILYFLPAHLLV